MADFYRAHDLELILGSPIDPVVFQDRVIDVLHKAVSRNLFSETSKNAIVALELVT